MFHRRLITIFFMAHSFSMLTACENLADDELATGASSLKSVASICEVNKVDDGYEVSLQGKKIKSKDAAKYVARFSAEGGQSANQEMTITNFSAYDKQIVVQVSVPQNADLSVAKIGEDSKTILVEKQDKPGNPGKLIASCAVALKAGCVPGVCQDGQCGIVSDGCDGTIDCGGCVEGKICNDANLCEDCPTAEETCANTCGTVTDICGAEVTCSCASGQFCNSTNARCESCGFCGPNQILQADKAVTAQGQSLTCQAVADMFADVLDEAQCDSLRSSYDAVRDECCKGPSNCQPLIDGVDLSEDAVAAMTSEEFTAHVGQEIRNRLNAEAEAITPEGSTPSCYLCNGAITVPERQSLAIDDSGTTCLSKFLEMLGGMEYDSPMCHLNKINYQEVCCNLQCEPSALCEPGDENCGDFTKPIIHAGENCEQDAPPEYGYKCDICAAKRSAWTAGHTPPFPKSPDQIINYRPGGEHQIWGWEHTCEQLYWRGLMQCTPTIICGALQNYAASPCGCEPTERTGSNDWCDICSGGEYPLRPDIKPSQFGVDDSSIENETCSEIYWLGRQGEIDASTCSQLRKDNIQKACGCRQADYD